MNKDLKFIIAGGKTGGHLFPGIAVAQAISRIEPSSHILFVGTGESFEIQTVARYGFEHKSITSMAIKGKSITRKLAALLHIPLSILQAMTIMKKYRPDMVLGVGGYASGPVLACAKMMGIPTAIHEQNSIAGITNKTLSYIVDTIFTSFDPTRGLDGARVMDGCKKIIHTGNPMRNGAGSAAPAQNVSESAATAQNGAESATPAQNQTEFATSARKRAGHKPSALDEDGIIASRQESIPLTVLVTGGSQGARSINTAVIEAVRKILDKVIEHGEETGEKKDQGKNHYGHGEHRNNPEIHCHIIHQTGALDENRVLNAYSELKNPKSLTNGYDAGCPVKVTASAFFHEMPQIMARADLIICRAGAGTISEITALGKPSLLVPYPHAADDHQTFNARILADKGAAWMVCDSELTGEYVVEKISFAANHPDYMKNMAVNSGKLGLPHADRAIAHSCINTARQALKAN
ncbi:MAG: UDP-N-acetylglucosamine--N-acetylmuramyl-(pentapeptide) pyrophosphoryl-undecaprenol N-acetylglucosamine transferase [Desulfamplus sp.]|nr:UDP-N-acetylglucosamine--N-acetylmuramyl-(pentapeptide) pyrophosphoryl-undecaprenol N-acetylglucosamine transferase [Desulfamplus sp.]